MIFERTLIHSLFTLYYIFVRMVTNLPYEDLMACLIRTAQTSQEGFHTQTPGRIQKVEPAILDLKIPVL